jgi:hypothetical protein
MQSSKRELCNLQIYAMTPLWSPSLVNQRQKLHRQGASSRPHVSTSHGYFSLCLQEDRCEHKGAPVGSTTQSSLACLHVRIHHRPLQNFARSWHRPRTCLFFNSFFAWPTQSENWTHKERLSLYTVRVPICILAYVSRNKVVYIRDLDFK